MNYKIINLFLVFLILLFGIMNIVSFSLDGTTLINKIIIYQDFKKHFEVPNGYYIDEINIIIITKINNEWYSIYVRLRNIQEPYCWINDFVNYNYKTKEVKTSIYEEILRGYKGVC